MQTYTNGKIYRHGDALDARSTAAIVSSCLKRWDSLNVAQQRLANELIDVIYYYEVRQDYGKPRRVEYPVINYVEG